MDIKGEYRIAASRERVWAGLNDPTVLGQCIPGCKTIDKTSDEEFTAKASLKVGPVKATFTGKVTLADIDPPNSYTIRGEGQGGVAGFAGGEAKVWLDDDGDATLLRYQATATVGGKLAQVGQRLLDATARKLAGEFFAAFAAVIEAQTEASPDAAVEPPEEATPTETAPAPATAALPPWIWIAAVLTVVGLILMVFGS